MFKDIWDGFCFKDILEESGIFVAIIFLINALFISILALPILPFYLFNEWSKSWFN